jgi:hypothetical protein
MNEKIEVNRENFQILNQIDIRTSASMLTIYVCCSKGKQGRGQMSVV